MADDSTTTPPTSTTSAPSAPAALPIAADPANAMGVPDLADVVPEPERRFSNSFKEKYRERLAKMAEDAKIAPSGDAKFTLAIPGRPAAPAAPPAIAPPALVVAAQTAPAAVPATTPAPAVPPPAPDMAVYEQAAARAAQIAAREIELERREKELAARSTTSSDWIERFTIDPVATIREMAKANLPTDATPAQIEEELAAVTTELSLIVGGVELPAETRKLASVEKQLKQLKAKEVRNERAAAEAKAKAEAEAKEIEAKTATSKRDQTGVATVSQFLEPIAKEYPWLARSQERNQLLWEHIRDHFDRTGERLEIEAAADTLNRALEQEIRRIYNPYLDLLSGNQAPAPVAAPTATTAPATTAPAHQQGHQSRSPAPPASTDAPRPPAPTLDSEPFDPEENRQRSLARMRERLRAAAAQS